MLYKQTGRLDHQLVAVRKDSRRDMLQSDASPVKPFSKAPGKYQPIWPTWSTFPVRLKSFAGTARWSKAHQLAATGFFYTGRSDTVRCFYCSLALGGWQENDDPMGEHERHQSECDYFAAVNETLPCVYATETAVACGRTEECPFCKWEEIARKQLLEDRFGVH